MDKQTLFLIVAACIEISFALSSIQGCKSFDEIYKSASSIVCKRSEHEKNLQAEGYVLSVGDLGFGKSRQVLSCNISNVLLSSVAKSGDQLNTAARLLSEKNPEAFATFGSNAKCLRRSEKEIKKQPKYRAINAYGNNLKHPHWGTPGMPFGRQAPKNYDDGVSSIRKSVTGSELPNPRELVTKVLLKAYKVTRTAKEQNFFSVLNALYLTHDMAHSSPVEAFDNCQEIRCCSSGNKKVLDPSVSHSACLPISISQDDEFYSKAGVGCLNMVRSESASAPTTVEHGEILNKVTAYIDHSIIYGSDDSENKQVRSFVGGKLRLGKNDVLPVDSNGKYTKTSDRLTSVPQSAIYAVLTSRSHNNLAVGLSKINPKWNDEKLFQEARRLNIALYQRIIFHDGLEVAFGEGFDGVYDENVNPAMTVEFNTAGYRFLHLYIRSFMMLKNASHNVVKIPVSDTFGRIDLLQNNFDDVLRGSLSTRLNFGQHSDEIYNKFAKNENGVGLDLFSIDIQRCREHGMPTYLTLRKHCGLKSDFKTFEDLLEILPQNHVDLLQELYDDVRDIDFYVGGSLESFLTFNTAVVGPVFECVIKKHFVDMLFSDAYYYTHKTSPYPFTEKQLAAIDTYNFPNFICANSGLETIAKDWATVSNDNDNPLVPCSNFPQIDLSAWKGI